MKLWVAASQAYHRDGEVRSLISIINANSEHSAMGIGFERIERTFPYADGYNQHSVQVMEITPEMINEVYPLVAMQEVSG